MMNGSTDIEPLIKELIRLNIQSKHPRAVVSEDVVEQMFDSAMSTMHETPSTSASGDEFAFTEKIKRHLVRKKRDEEALKFVDLVKKLRESGRIKNRNNILQFVYLLLTDGDGPPTPATKPSTNGTLSSSRSTGKLSKRAENTPLSSGATSRANPLCTGVIGPSPVVRGTSSTTGSSLSARFRLEKEKDALLASSSTASVPSVLSKSVQRMGISNGEASMSATPVVSRPLAASRSISGALKETHNYRPKTDSLNNLATLGGVSTPPVPDDTCHTVQSQEFHLTPYPSLEEQLRVERLVLNDLIYVLQGIDGQYVRYDHSTNKYVVDRALNVLPQMELKVLRLCEFGHMYRRISAFTESHLIPGESEGLFIQALSDCVSQQLRQFYRVLATMQDELHPKAGQNRKPGSEQPANSLTVLQMYTRLLGDWNEKLMLLCDMLELQREQNATGGQLLTLLYQYYRHDGMTVRRELEFEFLNTCCNSLKLFLFRWICEGYLNDPYGEFFITCDNSVAANELWAKRYRVNELMRPCFIGPETAEKVLTTGKCIVFLNSVCKQYQRVPELMDLRAEFEDEPGSLMFADERRLDSLVQKACEIANRYLLKKLMQDCHLIRYLETAKNYLLLIRGEFATDLMHELVNELDTPASGLRWHLLSMKLRGLLKDSLNARVSDPILENILENLDVKSSEDSGSEDTGWEVFEIILRVDGPLEPMFSSTKSNYSVCFKILWRLKRLNFLLRFVWNLKMHSRHLERRFPELRKLFRNGHSLCYEMLKFVEQFESFIVEEIDGSWCKMIEKIENATDFDSVLSLHEDFVSRTRETILMTDDCLNLFRDISTSIIEFTTKLNLFYDELEFALERTKKEIDRAELKTVANTLKSIYRPALDIMKLNYRHALHQFLQSLADDPMNSERLRQILYRIDESGFYQALDARLQRSLSFRASFRPRPSLKPVKHK